MAVELLLVAICIFLCAVSLALLGYSIYSHQRIKEMSDKAHRLRKTNDALAFEIGKMQSQKSAMLVADQQAQAEQRIEELLNENRELRLQVAELHSRQNRKSYVIDESGVVNTLESWRENNLR